MNISQTYDVIIIGSGPAGLTAAVYTARANLKPLLIEGSEPGGQLIGTSMVENWPGEKSILGPDLMRNMKEHAKHTGTEFKNGIIEKVDFSQKPFKLWTKKNELLLAHSVIIATGATPKKLHCPGEAEFWAKGVTTCAVCDGAFFKNRPVVIVGGGDTAMENASFMSNFTQDITIIHILDAFTASAAMQDRVKNMTYIKTIYNSTVTSIEGKDDAVTGVVITNRVTEKQETIPTNAVFLSIGLQPNTQPFVGHLDIEANGYIKIHDHVKTSVPGIFAAGDVTDYVYRQAITSAGSGCMAAMSAEHYLKSL